MLDLSEQDSADQPAALKQHDAGAEGALLDNGVKDISSVFSVSVAGELYTWGHTRITDKIDVANIPDEIKSADLVQLPPVRITSSRWTRTGEVYVWGNTRLQQDKFSNDMEKAMKAGGAVEDVVQLEARATSSPPSSAPDGNLYLWGNGNAYDIKIRSEIIRAKSFKVALTDAEYIALMTDGTVAYTGNKDKTLRS